MIFEEMIMGASSNVIEFGGLSVNIWWWPFLAAFVKNFFILLTIVLVVATFLVFYRFQSLRTRFYDAVGEAIESGKLSKGRTVKKWIEIKELSGSNLLEDNNKAVMLAMELLDSALKAASYSGESFEKRIAKVPVKQLNFKEDILWAGEIGRRISSNSTQGISKDETSRAVYIFERALKELNIL